MELDRLWCVRCPAQLLANSSTFLAILFNTGLPDDIVQIKSIEVSPDPPQPGQNLTVKVNGYTSEPIVVRHAPSSTYGTTNNCVLQEGAYADVTVKLGLIKLLQKRFDVCEEA